MLKIFFGKRSAFIEVFCQRDKVASALCASQCCGFDCVIWVGVIAIKLKACLWVQRCVASTDLVKLHKLSPPKHYFGGGESM